MRARALMVLGTASNAGKSITAAALCRIFADDGYDVAPFKAQNMSLNAAVTPDGREIGRAQAVQAECARRAAESDMNPVLLKPSGERRAQVVLNGRVWRDVDAWDYHTHRTRELFPQVVAAYERLASRCDLVVLEGAGSPAEINLRAGDIVNMRMADAADAACLLVADIDRGGALAAITGTLALLLPHERDRVRAFAFTRFRGDPALLAPAVRMLEERTGAPCAGVIPWIDDLGVDEEDGYLAPPPPRRWPDGDGVHRLLRIAAIAYPHVANATDLDALGSEPSVALRRAMHARDLDGADVVVLPGSKETVADVQWLRANAFGAAIVRHAANRPVIGICGGMQMLGRRIDDPDGVESGGSAVGLGLLPIDTTLASVKTTTRVRGAVADAFAGVLGHGAAFEGYEIHLGVTTRFDGVPFARVRGRDGVERDDGAVDASGRVTGTYVHGIFDDDAFRHAAVDALRARCGLAPAERRSAWRAQREARYDRLAAIVRGALDVPLLARCAGLAPRVPA